MALRILPVTISDINTIATIIVSSNQPDPLASAAFKTLTFEERLENTRIRYPRSFVSVNSFHMKVVDENGEMISYSRWRVPEDVWKSLRAEYGVEDVSEEDKERFDQEYKTKCVDDWPVGIDKEMVLPMEERMDKARKKFPPKEEPFIMLEQLNTHPDKQKRGAATKMLKWGMELADKHNLKICLEATPTGFPLYKSHGFEELETVVHHLKEHGGPDEYIHVMMVRYPTK